MKTFTARVLLIACLFVALPLARTEQAAAEPPVLGRLLESSGHGAPGQRYRKPFLHPRGVEALGRAKGKAAIERSCLYRCARVS